MRGRFWMGEGPKRNDSLGMLAKGSGRVMLAIVCRCYGNNVFIKRACDTCGFDTCEL